MSMNHASLPAASASGHFKGKLRRQRAILDAARDIIARSGEAGLTMLAVAAQAGVSPATPYNLFGSKQAILLAVYEEDASVFYDSFEERASDVPLERLFDLVDLAAEHWQRAPDFYKALLAVLNRRSAPDVGAGTWSPRTVCVHQVVADVAASGALVADAPVGLLVAMVIRMFRAVSQEWIDDQITLEGVRKHLGLGLCMLLGGLMHPEHAGALAEIRLRYVAIAEGAPLPIQ